MFSSLSSSFTLLFLPLCRDGLLPAALPFRSMAPLCGARHSQTQRLLSLAFLLLLLSYFCAVASAAPSPSPSPPFVPMPSLSPSSEFSLLLSLKSSWKDPSNSLASWNASKIPYCETWRGVTCSSNNATIIALDLASLSLSGPLPAFIANLSSLRTLNLAYNKLTGNIPPELGSLSSLEILHLRHNEFNGSIPESLFQITSLQFLLLENNNLSGNISSSISNLVNLRYFSFGDNALSGPLPPSITSLSRLVALYGGPNNLTGTIPVRLGDLGSLIHLDLYGNFLTGGIPSSIGSCTLLQDITMSNNQLSGTLPVELGRLHNLTSLDLSSNHFNGSIPAELGNLSALQTLDLHQNNLSGSITPSLGNLTLLKRLNLSHNNLSGEVPSNGVLINFSASSFEGNAFLCGGPLMNISCYSSPPPPTSVPSPSPTIQLSNGPSKSSKKPKIVAGVIGGVLLVSVLTLLAFLVRRWRSKETSQMQNRLTPDLSEVMSSCKMEMYAKNVNVSYDEIVAHAGYYDTAHVAGKGRFATVYRSDLPSGTYMAVKVFKNPIPQAAFEKELGVLELASHFNTLLPIRGFFVSEGEKAIFYDFMQKGTLYDVLHNNPEAPAQLDWAMRLNIAMGIAQGVAHLHKGSSIRVLHKDLKSTNVLLDEAMYPLVADYGLIGLVSKSLVETPGYAPPELKTNKKYTEKTDVYSFGVVLLELLTGKKPVSYIGDRQLNLITWALRLQRDGRGREVFSANLVESCPYPDYPDRALNLAVLCLSDQPAQRPTMSEIASILEGLGGNNSPIRSPGIQQHRPLLM